MDRELGVGLHAGCVVVEDATYRVSVNEGRIRFVKGAYLSMTCMTPFERRRSCCRTLALLTKMELLAKVMARFPPCNDFRTVPFGRLGEYPTKLLPLTI